MPDNCGMTDVHFYFNVPDKLQLACRLARKAFMQGTPMVLTAEAGALRQLDEMLWNMAPTDFLAHDCVLLDQEGAEGAAAGSLNTAMAPMIAPLQLRESIAANTLMQGGMPPTTLLLSLCNEVPAAFSHFERVYELVSAHDDADRDYARQRWRYYQQRGYAIHRHDLAQRNAR